MKHITIKLSILVLSVCILHNFSFTQTTFGDQIIIFESSAKWPQSVFSADLDGDGDMDVLSASRGDNKIAWYENIDGLGTFGDEQVITTLAWEARSVFVSDLDGDGDMDVLSASYKDDKIAWYENVDGFGTFGDQQVITTDADGAQCVFSCDLDEDGDKDVLSASVSDDKIAWYENTDGLGTFSDQIIISDSAVWAWWVTASDLDGDGDMDVLAGLPGIDEIVWYENTDNQETFGAKQVIANEVDMPSCVSTADLDGDGDMDVLSTLRDENKIVWYENTDGNGTFGVQQIVTDRVTVAVEVCVSDLDGDGDIDVLSASSWDNKIAWYENIDGQGTFGDQEVISMSVLRAQSVHASDLDGDGDMDVLFAAGGDGDVFFGTGLFGDRIAWYENTDGNGTFGEKPIIAKTADGARSVYASDLDGDGDMDVLAASKWDNKITFYENTDGNGVFGSQQVIIDSARDASSVTATDLDGDGDIDVLSASYYDDKIAWYENIDNNMTFGDQQIITIAARGATSVQASDIDGDGDMDVLSASDQDWKIAWYENIDGLGTFGEQNIITTTAKGAMCVYTSDLDGDGDMDVLAASRDDDTIAWWVNYDGQGSFGAKQVITTSADNAMSVFASDLDGDGDMDVLSASAYDDKIAWYENLDGLGSFGIQRLITTFTDAAYCVYAADLDDDGDMDVLSASFKRNSIDWFENMDGKGTFGDIQMIGMGDAGSSVYASDMDGDGDIDVVYTCMADDMIAWNRNLFIETGVIEKEPVTPIEFQLGQNYPNPFNNETVIQFDVKEKCNVNLAIYDMLGKWVVTITKGHYQPGSYKVRFDGAGLPSGIYFYRLQAEGFTAVRKMVLME